MKRRGGDTPLVVPTGEVSNFLPEDFDAVLSFMDAETQKKKLSL